MKNIKNIIKRGCLFGMIIFVANIFPMRMTEVGKKSLQSYIQKQKKREKQYFIYEMNDESNGIWVDKELAQKCKTIKAMAEDYGGETNIPLNIPIHTIKLVFGILDNKTDQHNLSFEELIDVANACNFLDVPTDKMNAVLVEIKEVIDQSDVENIVVNQVLKKLHPDLQKVLFVNISDYLKDCIIKKYVQDRGKSLVGHSASVGSVAMNSDGTKMISGCYIDQPKKNVILWDMNDPNNIFSHDILDNCGIGLVAISPDGKYAIGDSSRHWGNYLWNISDPNNITYKRFKTNLKGFSPDSKNFFGGALTIRDVNDPDKITSKQTLISHGYIFSKVFSPNGKLMAGTESHDYLKVWDISSAEINNHGYEKSKQEDLGGILYLAFSPDSKSIVSCGNKLILWDISDLHNITSAVLVDNIADLNIGRVGINSRSDIYSMILSHDGKKIALGYWNGFMLLDINNPHNRVRVECGHVHSMVFTPNDRQIVTGGKFRRVLLEEYLILWTLLTDEEEALLNQIKNYNANQVRLIYQLCLQSSKKQSIVLKKDSEEYQIFMTLPEDMRKLLTDLFLPKGWFSGWW